VRRFALAEFVGNRDERIAFLPIIDERNRQAGADRHAFFAADTRLAGALRDIFRHAADVIRVDENIA